jgi:hypothetical protein
VAEWIRLTELQPAQIAPNESKRADKRGHRPVATIAECHNRRNTNINAAAGSCSGRAAIQ